jgi:hypothetical protein
MNVDFYRSFNFKVEVCINCLVPTFGDLLFEYSLQFNMENRRGKIFEKLQHQFVHLGHPPPPKSIFDTVHGIFLKLSTNIGSIKVSLWILFTSPNLSTQEFSTDQGPKWTLGPYKFFFTRLQDRGLGFVLFERELFTASDEGKEFFYCCSL